MKTYSITEDDGCWLLLEDGIGMARSKSRNVLNRIRAALTTENALVGLTVEEDDGDHPRGVVLAVVAHDLVVRLPDGKLAEWTIGDCRIVDPDPIDRETLANEPSVNLPRAPGALVWAPPATLAQLRALALDWKANPTPLTWDEIKIVMDGVLVAYERALAATQVVANADTDRINWLEHDPNRLRDVLGRYNNEDVAVREAIDWFRSKEP